jgi:ABC-type methionine transport system ATPase subunit
MIKRFDIVTNIRAANITAEAGWLVVELSGESAQLEAALAWVMAQGVQVEWLTSPA